MAKISAVILTKNEARQIGRCIASLEGLVDEVLVIDAESEDTTRDIALSMGAKVVMEPWKGFSYARNKGIDLAVYPFILSIDADEALSDELRETLSALKAGLSGAYAFNRKAFYCGRWIRHCGWYPDTKLRLYPASGSRWEGEVHERLVLGSTLCVEHIRGDLLHYTVGSISEHLRKIDFYTQIWAEKQASEGKKSRYLQLLIKPFYKFLQMYLFKLGMLDGWQGYVLCRLSAFETYLRYAKLLSINRRPE